MSLTLHFHPLASFCWKVLVALYETHTPFVPNIVDLGDEQSRAGFFKLWPLGKFPVLQDDARGALVPESTIIVEYLAQHHPGRTMLIPADPELALQARLADRLYDFHLHEPMQKIVGDRLRPEDRRDPLGVEQARAQIRATYALLERDMAGRQWALGEVFSMADCAAFPALFYADRVEPLGQAHGTLAAYLVRLRRRPSVERVVQEARPYFHFFPYHDGRDP